MLKYCRVPLGHRCQSSVNRRSTGNLTRRMVESVGKAEKATQKCK